MLSIHVLEPTRFSELPYQLDPATSIVVVAEDDETKELKGMWAAQGVVHIEPIWLDESIKDGGFTGLKMLATLLATIAVNGDPTFYAFADRPEVAGYLERLGLKEIPYKTYVGYNPLVNPQKESECPQSVSD